MNPPAGQAIGRHTNCRESIHHLAYISKNMVLNIPNETDFHSVFKPLDMLSLGDWVTCIP